MASATEPGTVRYTDTQLGSWLCFTVWQAVIARFVVIHLLVYAMLVAVVLHDMRSGPRFKAKGREAFWPEESIFLGFLVEYGFEMEIMHGLYSTDNSITLRCNSLGKL